MAEEKERFLSRWARLKQQARETAPPDPQPPAPEAPRDAPPQLPPLEKLTLDSDYSHFFHPKVDENLRRAALKRLFSEPHFNVMDGLDVYIDDYSKPSPLPAEMLATLKQAQKILDWAKEGEGNGTQPGQAPLASEAQPALENPMATEDTYATRTATGEGHVEPAPSESTERKS